MAFAVFTAPAAARHSVDAAVAKRLRRAAWSAVSRWARDCFGLELGGYAQLHPTGDACSSCGLATGDLAMFGRCPRCGTEADWRPHFHVAWAALGWSSISGRYRQAPLFLEPHQLEALKVAWAMEIGRDRILRKVWKGQPINVHYCFRTRDTADKARQLQHRFRYDLRPFPAWRQSIPRGLASKAWYGLAHSRATRHEQWAAHVEVPEAERPEKRCFCGQPMAHTGVEVVPRELHHWPGAWFGADWFDLDQEPEPERPP